MSGAHKTRLTTILGEKVGTTAHPSESRPQKLKHAIDSFQIMRRKLRQVVVSLRAHHNSMVKMIATRRDVVGALSDVSLGYELEGFVAKNADGNTTYVGVHEAMAERNKGYCQKYEEFIINYAVEWERVLAERVAEDIKKVDNHKRDLDHYSKKVDSLRAQADKTMAKGKVVKADDIDKLQRNEYKLKVAETDFEESSTNLLLLIDEVVARGWKDLMPLMIKVAQFDATLASDEGSTFASLNEVVLNIKAIGDAYGVPSKPRLRALRLEPPANISTADVEARQLPAITNNASPSPEESTAIVPQSIVTRSSSPDFSVPDDEKSINVSPITIASEAVPKAALAKNGESTTIAPPSVPVIHEDRAAAPHVQEFKAKQLYASGRAHNGVLMSDASVDGGVETVIDQRSVSEEYSLAPEQAAKDGDDESFYSAVNKADKKATQGLAPKDDDASEMGKFVSERKSTNPFD
mmetsp:Transcript_28874/g.42410  ORF Transcript_28874/g.42410 Transcript_28874/m.42410 type:complete len:465 (-) Transcript_28874:225-1619(-)